MGYWKLGDEVWVVGEIVKIIESRDGVKYELKFKTGIGGWASNVVLEESDLIEKKGTEHVS